MRTRLATALTALTLSIPLLTPMAPVRADPVGADFHVPSWPAPSQRPTSRGDSQLVASLRSAAATPPWTPFPARASPVAEG
jgi:hypothetical protein